MCGHIIYEPVYHLLPLYDACVTCVGRMHTSTDVSLNPASPLACGVIDLIALATTYRDGVKGLEGAQADSRDGHEA